MSNEYLNKTEEQQFEDAKNWFKENGTPILVAIILVCAASLGWSFWKNHQLETAQKTSASYQRVMESYLQNPNKNQPLVEKFIADNQDSSYATFAQFEQAKQAVEKGDFFAAKVALQSALTQSDSTLKTLARFRLAQVDYQLKSYDEALAGLTQIQDKAWELRKQILIGDILVAKGDKPAAKMAYEQARLNAAPQEQTLIDVRLNNL